MRGDITINNHMGNQLSMEAYFSSPQTDRSALRNRIVAYIRSQGLYGATSDEVEAALELAHQTVSARMTEAKALNLIAANGDKRKTRMGRNAAAWVTL